MSKSILLVLLLAVALLFGCDNNGDDDFFFVSNEPVASATITPPSGSAGIATSGVAYSFNVTISGVNGVGSFVGSFSNPTGTISFAGLTISFTSLTQTAPFTFSVTGTVSGPFTGAGTLDITLTYSETGVIILNDTVSFTVMLPAFPPSLSQILPITGLDAGGTGVTLTGTNFISTSLVTFGGTLATNIVIVNSTTITCNTPAMPAGAVDVVVDNQNGQSSATLTNGFTYLASPPILDRVNSNSGLAAGGTAVTLTGSNFYPNALVTFEGALATNIVVNNSSSITCNTPTGTLNTFVDVIVDNQSGQPTSTLTDGFAYVALVVTTNGDSGAGSLRESLSFAVAGDFIGFESSLSGMMITLTSGELSLSQAQTIVGLGSSFLTINGNASSRIFNYSDTLQISGFTLTNGAVSGGNPTGNGGAIFGDGTLTMEDCLVSGNSSSNNGGGLFILGNVTLTNCTISENTTEGGGGGYSNGLGGATIVLTNCTFSGNTATGGGGGGFLNGGGGVTMVLANCTFSGNTSTGSGGGVLNGGGGAPMVLTNCTFSGNTSTEGGGLSFSGSGAANLTNCTFSGNTATGNGGGIYNGGTGAKPLINCTISGNASGDQGGGISNFGTTITLSNSIVAGNTATTSNPDVRGTFTSLGYNLIGDVGSVASFTATGDMAGTVGSPIDPLLGPLQDNGGLTFTHELLSGSPAIDMGDPASILSEDQRGEPRPFNFVIDIGSFENQN